MSHHRAQLATAIADGKFDGLTNAKAADSSDIMLLYATYLEEATQYLKLLKLKQSLFLMMPTMTDAPNNTWTLLKSRVAELMGSERASISAHIRWISLVSV